MKKSFQVIDLAITQESAKIVQKFVKTVISNFPYWQ